MSVRTLRASSTIARSAHMEIVDCVPDTIVSSAKKVSAPLPPVMKLDLVPPSIVLVLLVTAIASSPLPRWMNQLGRWW